MTEDICWMGLNWKPMLSNFSKGKLKKKIVLLSSNLIIMCIVRIVLFADCIDFLYRFWIFGDLFAVRKILSICLIQRFYLSFFSLFYCSLFHSSIKGWPSFLSCLKFCFSHEQGRHIVALLFLFEFKWNKFFKRFNYGLNSIRMDENSAFASTRESNRQDEIHNCFSHTCINWNALSVCVNWNPL